MRSIPLIILFLSFFTLQSFGELTTKKPNELTAITNTFVAAEDLLLLYDDSAAITKKYSITEADKRWAYKNNPVFTGTTFTFGAAVVTEAEFDRLAGVSSDIQAQLNAKASRTSPTFLTSARFDYATASRVPYFDSNKDLVSSSTTPTQLGYLSSATGTTGTTSTNLVFSASPTFTGTITAAAISSSNLVQSTRNGINFQAQSVATDATRKESRWTNGHYTNAEEPFGLLYADSNTSTNSLHIGGGSSQVNAATDITFYTAANSTTTAGTARLSISSAGLVTVGSSGGTQAHVTNGTWIINSGFTDTQGLSVRSSNTTGVSRMNVSNSDFSRYFHFIGDFSSGTENLSISSDNATIFNLTRAGLATFHNTTDATSSTAAAGLKTSGGLAVAKKAFFGDRIQVGPNAGTGGYLGLPNNSGITFRNAANDGNLEIYLDTSNRMVFPAQNLGVDGAVSTPTYGFASSTGSGLWLSGTHTLSLSSNGTKLNSINNTGTDWIGSATNKFRIMEALLDSSGLSMHRSSGVGFINNAGAFALNLQTDSITAIGISSGQVVSLPTYTASRVLTTDGSSNIAAASTTTTQLGYLASATGTTGTTSTNLVFSASPTFTGTVTFASGSISGSAWSFGASTFGGSGAVTYSGTTEATSSTAANVMNSGGLAVSKIIWGGSTIHSTKSGINFRAQSVDTDATRKESRWVNGHYTNSEEPFGLLYADSNTSTNALYIGGGSSQVNAATSINFYTAANSTTTAGTSRLSIDSAGLVEIGTTSGTQAHVTNGTWIVKTGSTDVNGISVRSSNTTGVSRMSLANSDDTKRGQWTADWTGGSESLGLNFLVGGSTKTFYTMTHSTGTTNFGLNVSSTSKTTGTVTITGGLGVSGNLYADQGRFGTNPGTGGALGIPNNTGITFRNAANSANYELYVDTSNVMQYPFAGNFFSNYITVGGNTTGDSNLGTISSVQLSSYYVGSASVTFTGAFSATQAKSVNYVKVGRMITLNIPTTSTTCNSAATINNTGTELPSSLRPAASTKWAVNGVFDNSGADINSALQIDTAGLITVYGTAAGGNFTASGSCGWDRSISVTYYSNN